MTYLALIQDDDWSLSKEELMRALRRDWPESEVDADGQGDPAMDVRWRNGAGENAVEGSAHDSGQCIYLDGQERPVAEFVSWYRGLVPPDRTVVLCDDTYSFDAVVDAGSNADEVMSLFP